MLSVKKAGKYTKFVLYILAVILINIASVTLFFRADLTHNQIFSLSPASQEVVSKLSEPLTVHVFFTKNLPAPHNQTERYLRDLLATYAAAANQYFNYRFFDVNPESEGTDPKSSENRNLADTYGIHPLQIQMVEQDEIKFKRAFMGLALIHGDIVERIPAITTTDDLEYRLTTAIQKLHNKVSALLNLKDNIRITLILSSSLKAVAPHMGIKDIADYPKAISDMVDRLNARLYRKLEFNHMDPTGDPDAENFLQKFNVLKLQWPALLDGKIDAGNAAIGLVMTNGEKSMELPVLNVLRIPIIGTRYEIVDLRRMEEMLNAGIERLVNINSELGYMADHGTPPLFGRGMGVQGDADALSGFSNLASQSYSLKPIQLKDEAVPANLGCLVIAGPVEPLSDWTLFQIDQALMRGTSLMLFPDALLESRDRQAMMMGGGQGLVPFDSGLERLFAHWGITVNKTLVLDENCFKQTLSREFGGGQQPLYFAPILKDENILKDLEFMKPIKGLVAFKVSPLVLDDDKLKKAGVRVYHLLSSSEKSWELEDQIVLNPMLLQPPPSDKEKGKKMLATLLEGEFTSYFTGKSIPEKPEPSEKKEAATKDNAQSSGSDEKTALPGIEPDKAFVTKGKPAKIFIMASSEMLKDNIIDPEGKNENALFALNLIDYLNNREEIAVLRGKVARFNPLYESSGFTKTVIKALMVAGLPVGVIFFGLGVWLMRSRRKKRIREMFQS